MQKAGQPSTRNDRRQNGLHVVARNPDEMMEKSQNLYIHCQRICNQVKTAQPHERLSVPNQRLCIAQACYPMNSRVRHTSRSRDWRQDTF